MSHHDPSVMKAIALGSFFVLFAILAGLTIPTAFADHATAEVSMALGSGAPGCEDTNECFIPATVTIDVGGQVTWSNDDTAPHTVTAGNLDVDSENVGTSLPNGFDSSMVLMDVTFSHTFDEAGTFDYFCMVHPWMIGTVIVEAEGAEEEEEHEMEGEASASGMLSDGTEVEIWTSVPSTGMAMDITVLFDDSEHVNYDIVASQDGETVLDDRAAHEHEGMGKHTTELLNSEKPVDVTINFQGYGIDTIIGPVGDQVVFTNVVPEFGTIATLILIVAIVSIIAVTARSKISLTPRI